MNTFPSIQRAAIAFWLISGIGAGAHLSAQLSRLNSRPPVSAIQVANEASWIWTVTENRTPERVLIRQRLRLALKPDVARLTLEVRGSVTVFANGIQVQVLKAGSHSIILTRFLNQGPGVVAFDVSSGTQDAGLRFELMVRYPDGRIVSAYSNGDEGISTQPNIGWQTAAFDDTSWMRAAVISQPAAILMGTNKPDAKPTSPVAPKIPVGLPDTSRLVRLWDIQGSRRPDQNPYAGPRSTGERMLLSAGMAADGDLPILASAGFTLLESAGDTLSTSETAEDVWDFSQADTDRNYARRANFDWSYFPHFAFPPARRRAGRDFTPVRCIEHDKQIPAYSPWDPAFVQYAARGMESLAQVFGGRDGVSALDLGIHGDYGEAGLFSGARMDVPLLREDWQRRFGEPHLHLGWWCADPLARDAFRTAMMAKYRTLAALNRAWQTEITSPDRITYPRNPSDGSRRRWLDFTHWYLDSITVVAQGLGEAAKKRFPNRLMMLPLGFSSEDPRGGNDNTGLVRLAARIGLDARSTHGGFRSFPENQSTMMGRISSAARFYGTPFWSEATGRLTPEEETGRIFSAISLGSKGIFDWPENVKSSRDMYYRLGKHLRVEKPVVDVAMFYPTTSHLLRQDAYPQILSRGCTEIRDVLNYDIVDEMMMMDGALERYRILVLWEGTVVEEAALTKIRDWVQNGGVLVAFDFGKIETPEGDRTWFTDLFGYAGRLKPLPAPVVGEPLDRIDLAQLRSEWTKPYGRGWTVFFPGRRARLRGYQEVVRYVTYHLSEIDRLKRDAIAVDDVWDGAFATLLTDKVIFYNPGKTAISRTISLAESSGAAITELRVRPASQSLNVNVEPGGIAVLPFDQAPVEMLFQCEAFRSLGTLKPEEGSAHHPGTGSTHVLVPTGNEISTRIRVEATGTYSVFYRCIRSGTLAPAEIKIGGIMLQGKTRSSSVWGQTMLCGKIRLAPGVHTLTLRPPPRQAIRADFVVLTSDTTVAGYAFAEK